MKPKTTPEQAVPPKRRSSRWEKEWKRRRIIAIIAAIVIIAAGGIIGYGFCDTHYKPWHQAVVKVNDRVFDMDYFVKMLRLYGATYDEAYGDEYNLSQNEQRISYAINTIHSNEVVRQKAEEYGIYADKITDDEIEEELRSQLGFDPDSESEVDFHQRVEDTLDEAGISSSTLEEMFLVPYILRDKLLEAIGNDEYPRDGEFAHAQIKAVLAGTEEEVLEIKGKWDGDFNQIIKDYSPTRYYPNGGYWLVMVYEPEDAEEQEEEGLYIQAILLATEEKAEEVTGEFDGSNFADLATTYSLDSSSTDSGDMGWMSLESIESKFGDLVTVQSLEINTLSAPISQNYPDEPVEWLPAGIESSVFDEFAFAEGSETSGVSDPIRDTNYTTQGGYWLVMIYEPEDAEEQEEEGLYTKAILLDSEEEAGVVAGEFDGSNFAMLAEENSLDSSAASGGDMGWMSLDDIESKFGAGVLATINNLSQDEMSRPIETIDGYWLIVVTEGDGEGEEGELYINAILLSTEDEAEEVADEFDGSNFADLAEEYSLDGSSEDGGVIGWMSQEDIESKFGAGVIAIINDLSQDEPSTPIYNEDVSKQSGYWMIEVLEKDEIELNEKHWDTLSQEAYIEIIEQAMDESEIKNYAEDDDDKLLWALKHV